MKSMLAKGRKVGAPVVNVRVVLNDGNSHSVDSSDVAFQEAARAAWREAYDKGSPKVLEPIMRVTVEAPSEYAGAVLTTIMQRRGTIIGQQEIGGITMTESEVPLAEMFGYATTLYDRPRRGKPTSRWSFPDTYRCRRRFNRSSSPPGARTRPKPARRHEGRQSMTPVR